VNIEWKPNPFHTKITIDEKDKELMLLNYQNEQYTCLFCDLADKLESNPETLTTEEFKKTLSKWEDICNLETNSPDIQYLYEYLDDVHYGGCLCIPMTCIRCFSEDLLGVSTLTAGKHQAYKIESAFKDSETTIDEAIEYLEKRPEYIRPENCNGDYETNIPRWESERLKAVEWLKDYKEKHGF
jgi:hypothetical protein